MSSSNKIALFIDGPNLFATAKALGFDIDYKRLLEEFQGRGTLVRAFYYFPNQLRDGMSRAVRPGDYIVGKVELVTLLVARSMVRITTAYKTDRQSRGCQPRACI